MRKAWMIIIAAIALGAIAPGSAAGDGPSGPAAAAIERGLGFLKKDAYRWKAEKTCAACHHAAVVVWASNEAKARGFAVDEPSLMELTAWTITNMQDNVAVPQAPPRDVINLGAVYTLLSLEAAAPLADESLSSDRLALLNHVVREQEADGSWGKPLDHRDPLGGPPEDIAILSRIALLQSGDTSISVTACLENAARWLGENAGNSSRQARNLRLWMGLEEGVAPEDLSPMIEAIRAEQNTDGGWSQTPEMASDAYATGQALYVLTRAGIGPGDEAMRRGGEFLTRTQREDGSWPMISRVNSKDMTPITAAGTAWAVLGLIRAGP